MRFRWLFSLTFLVLTTTAPARGENASKTPLPTVVVRVHSLEKVIDNIKLAVELAGQENVAPQIEGLIKTKIGPNGLEGIDLTRPLAAYVRIGQDLEGNLGAIMIPVVNEKAFLGLLESLNVNFAKDKNGVYTVKIGAPVDISFRFAHKYAYISVLKLNSEALNLENLVPPQQVFSVQSDAVLSATIRLDQIPEAARFIASVKLEEELSKLREKKLPGETSTQRELRKLALEEIVKRFQNLLRDGSALNGELEINRSSGEFTLNFGLSAKSGSELARDIQALANHKNLFGALQGPDSALWALVHLTLPDAVKKAWADVFDEGVEKGLATIQDPAQRRQAKAVAMDIAPTVKAGEIDAAFNLAGPNKNNRYSIIAALKLQNGAKLGKTLTDLAEGVLKALPQAQRAKIKLYATTVNGIPIHRFDIQDSFDAKLRGLLGDDNPIYLAFREDGVFLTLGDAGLDVLRKALASKGGVAAAPLQFEVSLARLIPVLAKSEEHQEIARKIFSGGETGKVRVAVEGGSSLRLRLTSRLSVLRVVGHISARAQAGLGIGD
jgi:hypothetical protein